LLPGEGCDTSAPNSIVGTALATASPSTLVLTPLNFEFIFNHMFAAYCGLVALESLDALRNCVMNLIQNSFEIIFTHEKGDWRRLS
jgi:hypothetical protein